MSHTEPSTFFIKSGYVSRDQSVYFEDSLSETTGVVHQPHVYPFAAYLARRFKCTYIIDIGCGHARKMVLLHPEFKLIGIDKSNDIHYCKDQYPFGQWIEMDLETNALPPLNPDIVRQSVVVCADVIEHLLDPTGLLKNLKWLLEFAPVALLTTPERDLVRGLEDFGPPSNPYYIREWNLAEMRQLLHSHGFLIAFDGLTANNDRDLEKKTCLFVLENNQQHPLTTAPPDFQVVAIMNAYNEADILVPSLQCLIQQGIHVYLIDNWSTDGTFELARTFLGQGLVGLERFPPGGPSRFWNWDQQLTRVEEVVKSLDADWFIHHDVDEMRDSLWGGVSLRDGLYHVDRSGFNCIDHTVIVFHPIDNAYQNGMSFGRYFKYYEFGKREGHFLQVKAWKNLGIPISLAATGGHQVNFERARVYPYKFLLRHYPIRSQSHGERKAFVERKQRVNPDERAKGWNWHYDLFQPGHCFLRNPAELEFYDPENFNQRYIVERLSGVGIRLENTEGSAANEPVTLQTPNQCARPASLQVQNGTAIFHGYQEFVLTKDTVHILPEDTASQKKRDLLRPYFVPRFLERRTVLDLGANGGLFSFWALQNGADRAIALDMDDTYWGMIQDASTKLGFEKISTAKANVSDWNQPADIVFALALVHWIYSCTAILGSLDAVIQKLAQLARYMLVVEWVDPADPAITFFHHVNWNKEFVGGPYTLDAFESALKSHFARFEYVGDVSPTRKLYVAFRVKHEVDFSGSLPLIMPKETVISRRHLATHDGIEYWSCLYDGGNVIHKQATLDLAEREAQFLSQMSSDFFPKVLDVRSEGGFSVITLEKIDGVPLLESLSDINTDSATMHGFFQQCLDLLCKLEDTGIQHRDIRPENILVRDGKPVLLDFGWAISREHASVTPGGLGFTSRPPDGSFCDVFSMGRVFEMINQRKYPGFDPVIQLMTEPDASMRITDLQVLKVLFASTSVSLSCDSEVEKMTEDLVIAQPGAAPEPYPRTIRQLLEQISQRNRRLLRFRTEQERLSQQLAVRTQEAQLLVEQVGERQHAVESLTAQLAAQTDKVNELVAQIGERQHAVEALTSELGAIHASKFWKLTSLWRSLFSRLR